MPGSGSRAGDGVALDAPTSSTRLDRVLERLTQAIVVVDSALAIAYANQAAKVLLGVDAAGEPLPDPWPEFRLRSFVKSLFGPEPPPAGRFVKTGKRTLWVEAVPPTQTEGAILIIDDVTHRDRARQSEREFLENAAHELRTPLAAIVSVMDVLEGGAKDIPEVRDQFLKHLRIQSERLSRLAHSFLVLARAQTGLEAPHLTAVPLRPLLNEIAGRLEPFHSVAVLVRCEPDVGALADPELLYRAVANVAENATKHTRTGEIVLEAVAHGEATEIEIRDTGPGMTPEERDRAFQRFYRSADRTDGFGLGLAIAGEAVRVLSGTIELDSEPGEGTRVRIALPTAKILG